MSLLVLSNVTIRYGRLTAVRNVGFALAEGEILFITGPNGAGKSSLLRPLPAPHRPPEAVSTLPGRTLPAAPPKISPVWASRWCRRAARCSPACRSRKT